MKEILRIEGGKFGDLTVEISGQAMAGKSVLMDRILSIIEADAWYQGRKLFRQCEYEGQRFYVPLHRGT